MTDVPAIISVVFRLVNVIILGVFAVHTIKTYVYPVLCEQVRERLAGLRALNESIRLERERSSTLAHELSTSEQEAKRLLDNVRLWRVRIDQNTAQKKEELDARVRFAAQVYEQQRAQYEQRSAREQLFKEAFIQARSQLESEFAQPKSNKIFIDGVLSKLEEA